MPGTNHLDSAFDLSFTFNNSPSKLWIDQKSKNILHCTALLSTAMADEPFTSTWSQQNTSKS